MAHLIKSIRCYHLLKPASVFSFSNALSLTSTVPVSHCAYSFYCFDKAVINFSCPSTLNKNCQKNVQPIKYFSSRKTIELKEVEDRVMESLSSYDKIDQDKLQRNSHFIKDLGLDSLDHVELIMAIEEEFGEEISDVDAEKLLTPQDMINYIADLYVEKYV